MTTKSETGFSEDIRFARSLGRPVWASSLSPSQCVHVCVWVCFMTVSKAKQSSLSFHPSSSSSSSSSPSFFGAAISWTEARKLCVGLLGWEAERIVERQGGGVGEGMAEGCGGLYIDTSMQLRLGLLMAAGMWGRKMGKGKRNGGSVHK